jgi:hypothetical protein
MDFELAETADGTPFATRLDGGTSFPATGAMTRVFVVEDDALTPCALRIFLTHESDVKFAGEYDVDFPWGIGSSRAVLPNPDPAVASSATGVNTKRPAAAKERLRLAGSWSKNVGHDME